MGSIPNPWFYRLINIFKAACVNILIFLSINGSWEHFFHWRKPGHLFVLYQRMLFAEFGWIWIKKIVKFCKLTSGGRTKIINTTYIFQAFSFGEPKTWSFKYNEYYLVGDSTYLDTLLWKSTPSCSESMETWAFSSVDRVCLQTSVAILILLNDRRLSLISSLYFLWEKIKPEEEYWTKKKFIFHWYFLWLWFNKILQIKEIILVKFLSQKVC